MLKGKELIELVKSNPDVPQNELARLAGYSKVDDKGRTRVLTQQFYAALLSAQGMVMKKAQGRGRPATNQVTVQTTGIVVIGKRYIEQFGLEPGNALDVVLAGDSIKLVPA